MQLEAAASQGEGEGAAASGGVDGSIDAPKRSAQTSRGDNAIVEMFKASSHPKIAVFHVLFKVASVVLFFLGTLLGLGYISWFVPCVILLCVDFWVVKNITGRIMVGLRWWSDIDEVYLYLSCHSHKAGNSHLFLSAGRRKRLEV